MKPFRRKTYRFHPETTVVEARVEEKVDVVTWEAGGRLRPSL